MKLISKILLASLLAASGYAKIGEKDYTLLIPKFIPVNATFDVSLISFNKYPSADLIEIYVIPDERIQLSNVEFKSYNGQANLNFSFANVEEGKVQTYKTVVDLKNIPVTGGEYFQIIFNFKGSSSVSADFQFLGIYKKKDNILGTIGGNDDVRALDKNYVSSQINFYKPQRNAGRAFLVDNNSSLSVEPANAEIKNLLVEFWVKAWELDTQILKIKNKNNTGAGFRLFTNSFQMLTVESDNITPEFFTQAFLGRNSWNHITVYFSENFQSLEFYSNSRLFYKYRLLNPVSPDQLKFEFAADKSDKSYALDLLRMFDYRNSLQLAFNNRNYLSFNPDSSYQLISYRFDENESIVTANEKVRCVINFPQYVKSDAPIFAKAPELNIIMMNGSYRLEWSGGDYKQTYQYVLEKSLNGYQYSPVITMPADNSSPRTYSATDAKDLISDVIYYRVKQVNSDGTVVYSSQVKVGQGALESFKLIQNYPNPFNPKTSIVVDLLEDSELEIIIYNLEGREIERLFEGRLAKGIHNFSFDGSKLPSGIYLCKVSTPSDSKIRKMILTK